MNQERGLGRILHFGLPIHAGPSPLLHALDAHMHVPGSSPDLHVSLLVKHFVVCQGGYPLCVAPES